MMATKKQKVAKPVMAWCTQFEADHLRQRRMVTMYLRLGNNYRAPSDTQYDYIIADARHYRVVPKKARATRGK